MVHKLKPENNAEIVWADPATKQKTDVAVLYLHGFSASRMEGMPTHRKFAKKYGCNLYLARLSDHGIQTSEALLDFTVKRLWNSAKEAYAIAKQLGKKVLIMSTSTGGTLALKLAASYPEVFGLINFSPNIAINDPAAFLLNDHWGLQIARLVFGGDYRVLDTTEEYKKYWYAKYRLEAIVQLEELIETAAVEKVFEKVKCPVFNGVYYKNEDHQDPVIKVSAVREMYRELGTPDSLKVFKEFPNAGTHVIASGMQSQSLDEVFKAVSAFADGKLKMQASGFKL
jgi:esterase/lipase